MEYLELKSRVQALIQMKQSSEERLRIEAAWLQAQIQPHFFFNTLNSIISLHGVDNEKMEELLLAFSDYLQMSFDFQNVDLVVPIDYELKLVRAYLVIEQIRFGDRVQIVWDTPNDIELLFLHYPFKPLWKMPFSMAFYHDRKGHCNHLHHRDGGAFYNSHF